MANAEMVFNIAKGKIGYYASLPAANDALVVVLLKASGLQSDAFLADHDDLAALLAASNDECDFTNYARKTLSSITPAVDDTNNRYTLTAAGLTWTAAGGAINNGTGKLLVCYDPDTTSGSDSSIIPLTGYPMGDTTDGTDLVVAWSDFLLIAS